MVRLTLSRYLPVDPAAWVFRRGLYGRPEVEAPVGLPPLRFSLSHVRGLMACLVTSELDIGVDVERTDRRLEPLALAEHAFAAHEVAELRACRPEIRQRRFFALWTLKEAYLKARGLPMLGNSSRCAFSLEAEVLRARFDPQLDDRQEDWQFSLLRPTATHTAATAIRCQGKAERPIVCRWFAELAPPATP